jgi:ubiquinol-cytochrome c reductase cytochrome c subunit
VHVVVMPRLPRLATAALLAVLAAAAPAAAQPPPLVRPEDESGMSLLQLGGALFASNCAICHGSRGEGVSPASGRRGGTAREGAGPSLVGVGRQAADFYLRTGYMPLDDPDKQPERHPVLLRDREIRALETYVDSLGGGPPVPTPHPERASVAEGLQQFSEHCAGCHQIVAEGGIVTGARVPPLDRATPTQIAEAVRIGPYVMPRFSERDISDAELDAVIAYVNYAKQPRDAGGWAINHLGPFPEGMVTWGIAAVVLVATCMLLGERLKRS